MLAHQKESKEFNRKILKEKNFKYLKGKKKFKNIAKIWPKKYLRMGRGRKRKKGRFQRDVGIVLSQKRDIFNYNRREDMKVFEAVKPQCLNHSLVSRHRIEA